MKIHHIGYLVRNVEKAKVKFLALGYKEISEKFFDEGRGIFILFMEKNGYVVELVEPHGEKSVVAGIYKKLRNSPYHICYESDTFEADMSMLRREGFLPISSSEPAPAISGKNVIFLMHSELGMIELIENR